MGARALDYRLAAIILHDAAFLGDVKAAELHNVTIRTIVRYRKRSQSDAKLSRAVAELQGKTTQIRPPQTTEAISALVAWVKEAPNELEYTASNVAVVVDAIKTLSDIEITKAFVEVKLAAVGASINQESQRLIEAEVVEPANA